MNTVHLSPTPGNSSHGDVLNPVDIVDFEHAVGYQPSPAEAAELAAPWMLTNLADWVADQASFLRSEGSPADEWLAGKLDELVVRIRFLGAFTPEQFEDRNATLLRDQLIVRPSSRTVPGRYRAWDVVDGLGTVQPCSDLFDAMMLVQSRNPG